MSGEEIEGIIGSVVWGLVILMFAYWIFFG